MSISQDWWLKGAVAFICVAALSPIFVILLSWMHIDGQLWQHFSTNVLWRLVGNTLVLTLGVGVGVTAIGVSTAWLVANYEFPGRKYAEWLLMLPLAIPAYVLAFIALGIFDHFGPLQSIITSLGIEQRIPDIRSPLGVVVVMSLVLYPYVYMLSRLAFKGAGHNLYLAARNLGYGPWKSFFKLALPVARPSIMAGTSLAIMEALADFGAVSVFNFDTFTTAIYKAWFGFYSLDAAAQLSSLLLTFVITIIFIERLLRFRAQYHTKQGGETIRKPLETRHAWLASLFCFSIIVIAFFMPIIQLFHWIYTEASRWDSRIFDLVLHTLSLGVMAAVLTVVAAFLMSYNARLRKSTLSKAASFSASFGYALPGSILAVSIMMTVNWLDQSLVVPVVQWFGGVDTVILSGTLFGLSLAYLVRFLAVANGPVSTAFERIHNNMTEAAQSLGAQRRQIVKRLYFPLLRPGLLTGLMMVVIEVMKEMPATLLLRPFGWDTLAVKIYEHTSEGEWESAAVPALFLIVAGLLPVVLLIRKSYSR